jgi:hypothetical protein
MLFRQETLDLRKDRLIRRVVCHVDLPMSIDAPAGLRPPISSTGISGVLAARYAPDL